jgi:FtsZ-interacting cell division protein YlmF
MTIAEFKTVLLSNKLANQLKNTQEIEVTFLEPKEFAELLDAKTDFF